LHKTPQVQLIEQPDSSQLQLQLQLHNNSNHELHYTFTDNAYFGGQNWRGVLNAQGNTQLQLDINSSGRWYDFSLSCAEFAGFNQRFAGRMENGEDSISDPRMGNSAD
jgi:phospholipase C